MNNNEKQNNKKTDNIIVGIENVSTKNECESITPRRVRECPNCHSVISYSRKNSFDSATRKNSKCRACGIRKYPVRDVYTKKCSACGDVIVYSSRHTFCTSIPNAKCKQCCINELNEKRRNKYSEYKQMVDVVEKRLLEEAQQRRANKIKLREGHSHTQEHKDSIRGAGNPMYGVHRYGEQNPFYGKRHDAEARRRMRVAACYKVLRRTSNGRLSAIGKGERQYFDQLEKENGWFGNRQHFVSHLGYFLDYYEPSLNIVVEYDEPRHYRQGILIERDRKRMEEIKSHLGCQFWRYDEYNECLRKF